MKVLNNATSIAIGIDVGGTFTDLVAQRDGCDFVVKVPTTPHDQSVGVMAALQELGSSLGLELRELLECTELIVHGTTVGTNAMLEFRGANTYMLTTKGFRDILDIRRNYREAAFDLTLKPPFPIVPRHKRLAVRGRIDSAGTEVSPLSREDVLRAAEQMRLGGAESVAVCYLFSFLNPEHEVATRDILTEVLGDIPVSLSHEVLPKIREYERFSTTAVDAYTTPVLTKYLNRLQDQLHANGYGPDLYVMRSNGGMTQIGGVEIRGSELLLSGPAAGVVASARIGAQIEVPDLITLDMGGTSCDVALIEAGQPRLGAEAWISRHRVSVPLIDVTTIGAGGGSLAWVDDGRALRIGPESAGSVPGPACYGRGGTRPTVSDANLLLGLLPESLGSSLTLDRAAAEAAVQEHVATPLGMSVLDSALAIREVVNQSMVNAVRVVSLERGKDPRDFALMPFGGAGPVHAAPLARELGMTRVVVPRTYAPVLCALGDAISDVRETRIQSFYARGASLNIDELVGVFDLMDTAAIKVLPPIAANSEGFVERHLEMRYQGQTHEAAVPIHDGEWPFDPGHWASVRQRFDQIHQEQFSFARPESEVEIVTLRLDRWVQRERGPSGSAGPATKVPPARRLARFPDRPDQEQVPVYHGPSLAPGEELTGPALIDEGNTTIVVLNGQKMYVLDDKAYVIEEIK